MYSFTRPLFSGDGVVNLDLLAGEQQRELGRTEALTLGWGHLHVLDSDSLEKVTDGREVAALTLGEVVGDLIGSGGGVGLQGQEVVGDLVAVLLDGLEHVVGHVLDGGRDGGEESLLLGGDVLHGALLHGLGLSLTELDGTDNVLVEVGNHGGAEGADGLAVLRGGGLPVHDNTGGLLEATLERLGVGSDGVGQGVHAGGEHGLGVSEGGGGIGLGGGEGALEGGEGLLLGGGVLGELAVQTLGGLGQVLLEAKEVGSLLGAGLLDLGVGLLGEVGNLLGGGGLVLVHDLADDTTGLLVGGVGLVGELDETANLGGHVLVDAVLGSGVGDDHGGHILDVTVEAGLDLLDHGGGSSNAGGHVLAGSSDGLGGLLAGILQVLDGLGETGILKSGLGSDLVVEVGDSTCELLVEVLAVVGHLDVDRRELLVGELAGVGDTILDSLDDRVVAGSGGGGHSGEVGGGGLAGGLEGGVDGSSVGLHLGANLLGVLDHLVGGGGQVLVGLLDRLLGLLGLGQEGLVLGSDSVVDLANGVGLLLGNGGGESGALSGGLALLSLEAGVELGELTLGPSDDLLQVLLGDLGLGRDSVQDLLLHLGTGLLGLEVELVDLGVDALGELGDLVVNAHVEVGTGLLVHGLHLLLDRESALLTLVDGVTDSVLELGLVEGRDLTELGTAIGILDGVLGDDTSELHDLGVVLDSHAVHSLVEASDLLGETSLGLLEGGLSIELGAAGGLGELLVGLILGHLVLLQGVVQSTGLAGEASLGGGTVLLHLSLDGVDG